MEVKTLLNKAWYYSIFPIAAFPLLGIKLTSTFIIVFGLISLLSIINGGKTSFKKEHVKWLILFSSLYLTYVISAFFYPFDRASGFVLEKKLSLLIFPIALFLTPYVIEKNHFKKILLTYAFTCLGIALYTNLVILIKGIPEHYLKIADFSYSYRTFFEDISHLHPTYISIYLGFAALIFIKFGFTKTKKNSIYLLSFFGCIAMLTPLVAKLPIIAFIAALSAFFMIQPFIWKKVRFWFVGLIIGMLVALFTIPSLKIRMDEVINASFNPPKGYSYTSMEVRTGVWQCSTALIKENWLTGVGAGQIQDHLNKCYRKFNTNAYTSVDYNTHNEYFNVLLSTGVIGLLLFLLVLMLLVYYSIRYKKPLLFSFMVLILLCFTTENILSRQGGIVFFAFFSALLTRYYILQAESKL